jgi:hypothetical protein
VDSPDISPVGFAGTDHPRSTLERRRNVWWLLLGALLILVGIAGIVRFVVQMADPEAAIDGDRVAAGRVAALTGSPSAPATFFVETAGRYTVWLDVGDVVAGSARSVVVSAANCTATFADDTTRSFRGAAQGTSVEFGDLATVGTFDAPVGDVEVSCRAELFGSRVFRDQLEVERNFSVYTGSPDVGWTTFVTLFVAIPALVLGAMAIGRGWLGSLRKRRPSTGPGVNV